MTKIFNRNRDVIQKSFSLVDLNETGNVVIPRYVRVNTIKANIKVVCDHFDHSGLSNYKIDPTCPNLLVFPPMTDLHTHPLYTQGRVVLQDKASCLAAHLLKPPLHAHVIDCCAAPGNKTSLLCATMKNSGRVFAFDIDSERVQVLQRQMTLFGCSSATVLHKDFLSVDPNDPSFDQVTHILVDPSCSGSGCVGDIFEGWNYRTRIRSLRAFQRRILIHALSFPSVRRVIYSTCSINVEENEHVVQFVCIWVFYD
ncbi:28S rRNA (cytosine-C(5))-methyltransferase-like [Octopus sinensis]|uniref:28S rRNA (Cytosine-C(5))-methyltransferase-like n=1 Tax=Octopus sinensis TaxID=2607531 RepID=A0A6P7U1Z0_9MOLL|nr:28S rRNA (cytosine-C(5))-methyltransferase-like [Octopus sinensis]